MALNGNRKTASRTAVVLLCVGIFACRAVPQPSLIDQAERFVRALNAGDVNELVAVSESPFLLRVQEWESTSDGNGFVLGAASDSLHAGPDERARLFRKLVGEVTVESHKAAGLRAFKTLSGELAAASSRWTELALFVFLRGEADVEHIAVVGVDRRSGKVTALYLN